MTARRRKVKTPPTNHELNLLFETEVLGWDLAEDGNPRSDYGSDLAAAWSGYEALHMEFPSLDLQIRVHSSGYVDVMLWDGEFEHYVTEAGGPAEAIRDVCLLFADVDAFKERAK